MDRYTELVVGLAIVFLLAAIVTAGVWAVNYDLNAERMCLERSYPRFVVSAGGEIYCVKTIDQTEHVIHVGRERRIGYDGNDPYGDR